MLKKFSLDKIYVAKDAISKDASLTHHSFTINSQFLYELKHMVHLFKTVRGIFHFQFRLVFIKLHIFVQQKAWTL